MKKPYKPVEPRKPQAPLKTYKMPHHIEINGCVGLDTIIAQIPAGIELKDVFISVDSQDDYSSDCSCCGPYTYTQVYGLYYTEEPNPKYDSQKERYENDMKEYHNKLATFKPKFEQYVKLKTEYDTWFTNSVEENRKLRDKKELHALRKKVEHLEKKLKNVK